MTRKQREAWRLHIKGTPVSDIARIMGKTESAVYSLIKRAKASAEAPVVKKSVPCKHSPSCFTCPLKDCTMWESAITRTNLLPGDAEWDRQN